MTDALSATRRRLLAQLKRYLRAPEQERTPILRSLAEGFVDAREHFTRPDGSPDWKGRSYAYRVFVRDLYTSAGVQKDEQATLQSAIRYHVGTVLRERLDEDTLADYHLIAHSPRERSQDRREQRAALLSALTARDLHGGALLALTTASTLLSRLDAAAFGDLDPKAAEVALATLRDLSRRVNGLLEALDPSATPG